MQITIDDREVRRQLDRVVKAGNDPSPPLRWFYADWKAVVSAAWSKVRAPGGEFRGEKWAPMKAQYTRKTDGVTVPAWGGVRKLRGKGNVKAKLRPSGKRVRQTSVVSMDTGNLKNAILSTRPTILNRNTLRIGGTLPEYAEPVLKDTKRNPLRWVLPTDQRRFEFFVRKWLDQIAAGK